MTGRLQDKVAIITGASSGIGRAAALRFSKEGAKVVIADRNRVGGEETLQLIKDTGAEAIYTSLDVSDSTQVQSTITSTVDRFGQIDVLVNGAGVLIRTPPIVDVDERDWDLTMDTNLKGLFFCCKYAIPEMLKSGGGSIVNLASQAGLRGYAISVPYAVSKAGVIHFTMVTASQYTEHGIRANAIAPGPVDTPQFRGSTASAQMAEYRADIHPMKRVGRPDEISNVILFLASDESSFISGTTCLVDGGAWASAKL